MTGLHAETECSSHKKMTFVNNVCERANSGQCIFMLVASSQCNLWLAAKDGHCRTVQVFTEG